MLIKLERAINGRGSALVTVLAFAQAAVNANRGVHIAALEVQAARINHPRGVADITTKADRKLIIGHAETGIITAHGPRNREITRAILHLNGLCGDFPGDTKGIMDMPARAGTAKPGKVKPSAGKAFGYIAGIIDAQKKKRYAPRTGALQGR